MAKQHLELGYVRAAHGLRGEVSVRTFDPGSETLYEVQRLWARRRSGEESQLTIEAVREAPKGDLLVAFTEVITREDAEALVGSTLMAFRDDLEKPGDDEMFQGDLIGLEAVDESGAPLGKIEELWSSGPVPNLVIRGGARGELMVPFVGEFVKSVDVEKGRVVIVPPEMIE
jgi:16S rRNA processing protein RimM